MTLEEYDKKLSKTIQQMVNNHNGVMMVNIGLHALHLLSDRVQKTGVNAKGQKYAPYSTKPTLIGSSSFIRKDVADRLFGSKSKRKALEWRTLGEGESARRLAILQGGYKKIRELQGRQTNHVDFNVTGQMWTDITLISNRSDHANGIAIIGTKDKESNDKLSGNTKRKGDILDLSRAEIIILEKEYGIGVLQIFKENGL